MNLSNTELTGNTFHRMMPSLHSLILDCCSSLNGQGLYSIAKRYNYMLLHNWDWCFKLMYNLSSHIFLKSLNHSFVYFSWLIWIFVYLLAAKTSASQAGPKFKTVRQRVLYERIVQEILRRSGYFRLLHKCEKGNRIASLQNNLKKHGLQSLRQNDTFIRFRSTVWWDWCCCSWCNTSGGLCSIQCVSTELILSARVGVVLPLKFCFFSHFVEEI